jgi:hypothetical protein
MVSRVGSPNGPRRPGSAAPRKNQRAIDRSGPFHRLTCYERKEAFEHHRLGASCWSAFGIAWENLHSALAFSLDTDWSSHGSATKTRPWSRVILNSSSVLRMHLVDCERGT